MDRTPPTVAEPPAAVEPAPEPKRTARKTAASRKRTAAEPATAEQPPATETTTGTTTETTTGPEATEPAAEPASALAGFSDVQHVALDARGVPAHRGARLLLWLEWKRTGLSPFADHLYLRQDWTTAKIQNEIGNFVERKVLVYSVGTKITGFRVVAQGRDTYRGQTPPMWFGQDGVPGRVWSAGIAPTGCVVGVRIDGYDEPMYGVALYREFKPETASTKSSWVKMPSHMTRIAAESQALRMAYPDKLSGIYTDEEMAHTFAEIENATITGAPLPSGVLIGETIDRPAEVPAEDGGQAPEASASPAVDGLMAAAQAAEALAYLREHPGKFDGVYERAGRMGLLYANLADEGGATLKDAMAAFWCAHVADVAEFQPGTIPDIRATAKRRRLLNTPVPGDSELTLRMFLDALENRPADTAPAEPYDDGTPEPPEGEDWHIPGKPADRHGPDAPPAPVACALCSEEVNPRTPPSYVGGERVCQGCANTASAVGAPPF